MHDTFAGSIRITDARCFHTQAHIAAIAPAILPLPARPGPVFMGFEHQRKPGLGDFDAAELYAAGRVPLADRRIPVPRRRSAAAGSCLEHVPDEAPSRSRVSPVQRDAQPAPPTAHRPLRTSLRQGHDDRLDDLVRAMTGAHRHRRPLARPDDGSFLELHRQRPKCSLVLGDVRIEQERKRHRHRRLAVGMRRVNEPGDLRIGLGEVDHHVAAALGDPGANDDIGLVEPIVVQHRLSEIHSIGPARDDLPSVAFSRIQHRIDRLCQSLRTDLLDDGGQPLLAQTRRTDLRGQIAAEIPGMTDIQRQHLQQVFAQHAVLGQSHRRQAQALVPDFRRGWIVRAMRRPADIGMMRSNHRPKHQRRPG